jgi:type II secretory pathway pseudopilin PulG
MATVFGEPRHVRRLENVHENSVLHLGGQYTRREKTPRAGAGTDACGEQGFAMAALLVSIAVMGVLMTVAMPVWNHANQREKEAELIFRAGQYVRAIELFKRRYANTYPPNLDVLVQQRFLRKKYKDPITGGDFKFLSALEMQTAGAPMPAQRLPGRAVAPGREVTVQIAGVASRSTATSIRIYKNRQQYNQWVVTPDEVFLRNRQAAGPVAQPGQRQPGVGQPGVGQPGTGQPGTRPGGSSFGTPSSNPGSGQRPPGGP